MSAPSSRIGALDAARGILMGLGILLHAANPYTVSQFWVVSDRTQSVFFDWLSAGIHVFRMPAFFWVAGLFCAMTLDRIGAGPLVRRRIPRLVVPLIATWATFNVAQVLVVGIHEGLSPGDALARGVWLHHLWFLVDLVVYTVIAALLFGRDQRATRWLEVACGAARGPVALLLLLAAGTIALTLTVRATGLAYTSLLGLTSPLRLAEHLPFFLFGVVAYRARGARKVFAAIHPAWAAPAILVALAISFNLPQGTPRIWVEAAGAAIVLLTWIIVAAVIALFERLFKRDTAVTAFIADASYSVYLSHHLLVIAFAILLMPLTWSAWPKYLLVVLATLLCSVAFHVLAVQPFRPMRYLFNGR